jgi:hypothetical protein
MREREKGEERGRGNEFISYWLLVADRSLHTEQSQ